MNFAKNLALSAHCEDESTGKVFCDGSCVHNPPALHLAKCIEVTTGITYAAKCRGPEILSLLMRQMSRGFNWSMYSQHVPSDVKNSLNWTFHGLRAFTLHSKKYDIFDVCQQASDRGAPVFHPLSKENFDFNRLILLCNVVKDGNFGDDDARVIFVDNMIDFFFHAIIAGGFIPADNFKKAIQFAITVDAAHIAGIIVDTHREYDPNSHRLPGTQYGLYGNAERKRQNRPPPYKYDYPYVHPAAPIRFYVRQVQMQEALQDVTAHITATLGGSDIAFDAKDDWNPWKFVYASLVHAGADPTKGVQYYDIARPSHKTDECAITTFMTAAHVDKQIILLTKLLVNAKSLEDVTIHAQQPFYTTLAKIVNMRRGHNAKQLFDICPENNWDGVLLGVPKIVVRRLLRRGLVDPSSSVSATYARMATCNKADCTFFKDALKPINKMKNLWGLLDIQRFHYFLLCNLRRRENADNATLNAVTIDVVAFFFRRTPC